MLFAVPIVCCLLLPLDSGAQQATATVTAESEGKIWVDEQTGSLLPLDVDFLDENGAGVTLGSLIDKPTILLPIYFYCPNSCSTNLANLCRGDEPDEDDRRKRLPGNRLEFQRA